MIERTTYLEKAFPRYKVTVDEVASGTYSYATTEDVSSAQLQFRGTVTLK